MNAEDLLIQSKVINIDKKKETTIFEDEVTITTSENNIIKK